MKQLKFRAKSFLNGYYYPLFVFAAALISHTFSIEVFGIACLALTACIGFLLCDDIKFLSSPLIAFILMFSQKSVASGTFYSTGYIIAIAVFAVILFALIVAHMVIYKDKKDFVGFYKSKLFWGLVALSVALILNGFFNFDEYVFGNIAFSFVLAISFFGIFFLFRTGLKNTPELQNYIFYVLYLTSVLVTLQLYLSFIFQIETVDGSIVKESIMLGWGMWNNVGGILAFLLPTHFYFATVSKRYSYLFYFSGLLSYFAIVLSLSRSSLLVSSGIIIACALISCFKGNNKKSNRVITCAVAIIGIVGVIVLWDKISSILNDYLSRGLDDNGRFDIYRRGWENFLNNPIFGGGFHSAKAQEHTFVAFMPDRYHNTIIQLLGTCGIVGFLAYCFHRYQTVALLWKKRGLYTAFSALCIGAFLLTSLLDNHFFNIYPCFIYSIILSVLDITDNK